MRFPLTLARNRRARLGAAVTCAMTLLMACSRSQDSAPVYESARATRADLQQHVTASGSLAALVSVDVGSQVSGKVIALHVDFNSPVKKGQLVAEIDPTLYLATLRQAEGELASAQAAVTLRKQNLERKRALVPVRAASQLDLDQATAELAQAEATVLIREAARQSAAANVSFCQITAPVDGIVIARKVDVGQTVIAAMNTPVLFTIAKDLRRMQINTAVAESDVGQVRLGQSVEFSVDAFPDETFRGRVTQIRKSPTTTQNVVTYECVITADNAEEKLFPGMTADVSILVRDQRAVLTVPNTALRFVPPAGVEVKAAQLPTLTRSQRLLYAVAEDGRTLTPLVVKAGMTDGVRTEIVAGLSDGMTVVTSTRAGMPAPRQSAFTPPTPPPQT